MNTIIVVGDEFQKLSAENGAQTKEGAYAFFLSLLLDEFQSESDPERDEVLLQRLVNIGVINSMNDDLLITTIITSIGNEDGDCQTHEENVSAVNIVLKKYFKAVSFYVNGKVVSLLVATKGGFDKFLHIAVEEIDEKVRCIMGKYALIGIGRIEKGLSNTHKTYVDAMKAIGYAEQKKRGIYFLADMEQYKDRTTLIGEQALNIIEENYMEQNLSLVSVSNEIAVSPNYLSFIIKKSTGSNFSDLLSKKRIMVAKELLLSSNLKIREIAEKCGYSDQHYFSYCFKKYTGMSPNACRRMESRENKQNE